MLQNCVLLVHFFTGLIVMVISFIMGLLESTAQANSLLKVGIFMLNITFIFAFFATLDILLQQSGWEGYLIAELLQISLYIERRTFHLKNDC